MRTLAMVVGALFSGANLVAAVTSSQGLVVGVAEIYVLGVSSSSVTLNLATPTAGSDFSPATDSSTSYSVTVNSVQNRKIAASLSTAMPTGMNLGLTMQAPSGGTSQGSIALGTTAKDAVLNVLDVAASNLTLGYSLSCSIGQSAVGSGSRVVTMTLVNQ